jgi:hypothetical protein
LSLDELGTILRNDAVSAALDARESDLDVVLAPDPPLDPAGDPVGATSTVRDYRAVGATGLSVRFRHRSKQHYLEQLEAMVGVARQATEGP